jgi:class 3 adenylate cyclase
MMVTERFITSIKKLLNDERKGKPVEQLKSLETQIAEVEQAIIALEAQRGLLGQGIVETAVASLRETLIVLQNSGADQRKYVTMLFADLVNSTPLAETLAPEEWREIQAEYFRCWRDIIEQHGGVVEKFIGDAVVAIFGVPTAAKDDAARAVQAGLDLHQSLAQIKTPEPLRMRVGINTGPVIVGVLEAGGDMIATGDAVNLAARLQTNASPGATLIDDDTYQLVRGLFECEALPPLIVKGKVESIQTYLVKASLTGHDVKSSLTSQLAQP